MRCRVLGSCVSGWWTPRLHPEDLDLEIQGLENLKSSTAETFFAFVGLYLNLLLCSVLIVSSFYILATDNEGNLITITYVVSYLKYIQMQATYFLSLASLTNLCPLNFMPSWLYAVRSGNIRSPEITVQKEGDHRLK